MSRGIVDTHRAQVRATKNSRNSANASPSASCVIKEKFAIQMPQGRRARPTSKHSKAIIVFQNPYKVQEAGGERWKASKQHEAETERSYRSDSPSAKKNRSIHMFQDAFTISVSRASCHLRKTRVLPTRAEIGATTINVSTSEKFSPLRKLAIRLSGRCWGHCSACG